MYKLPFTAYCKECGFNIRACKDIQSLNTQIWKNVFSSCSDLELKVSEVSYNSKKTTSVSPLAKALHSAFPETCSVEKGSEFPKHKTEGIFLMRKKAKVRDEEIAYYPDMKSNEMVILEDARDAGNTVTGICVLITLRYS